MKQKLKRFMAGFMAMLTLVGTLFHEWYNSICSQSAGKYCVLECISQKFRRSK